MPKFVIERNLQGVGRMTNEQLAGVSQSSCGVLRDLGPEIQWIESFVTDDKMYCFYIAPNEEMIREHARLGGFPADSIRPVRAVLDPTWAEMGWAGLLMGPTRAVSARSRVSYDRD